MSGAHWTGSFTTASGAQYQVFEAEGDLYITRDCEIPVVNWGSGDPMPEITATKVAFASPPEVGRRFQYWADSHGGCLSTAVASVTEAIECDTTPEHGDKHIDPSNGECLHPDHEGEEFN